MKILRSLAFILSLTVHSFYFYQESIGCVVSPSEQVVNVGQSVSISCSARPNNEQRGSITFLRMRNGGPSRGTLIFQPPVYDVDSELITSQYVADGYFLEYLDRKHTNVRIQINETQLKHGGQYLCICSGSTLLVGTMELIVFAQEKKLCSTAGRTGFYIALVSVLVVLFVFVLLFANKKKTYCDRIVNTIKKYARPGYVETIEERQKDDSCQE